MKYYYKLKLTTLTSSGALLCRKITNYHNNYMHNEPDALVIFSTIINKNSRLAVQLAALAIFVHLPPKKADYFFLIISIFLCSLCKMFLHYYYKHIHKLIFVLTWQVAFQFHSLFFDLLWVKLSTLLQRAERWRGRRGRLETPPLRESSRDGSSGDENLCSSLA